MKWVAWAMVWALAAALLLPAVLARAEAAPVLEEAGLAWTSRTTGSSQWLHGVAEGRGTVVVAGDAGEILTSPDGATWTRRTSGTSQQLNAVAFGGGVFVAVGREGTILSSADGGAAWTARSSGLQLSLNAVTHANGLFVAVGDQGTVLTSADGAAWAARKTGTEAKLYAVAHGGGRFVAVGAGGTVLTSSDGISWSAGNSGTSRYLTGVAWGNGLFLAVGEGDTVLTSGNGLAWTVHPMNPPGSYGLWGVTFGEGLFVAAGGIGNALATTDGTRWVRHDTAGSFAFLENVVYVGGQFLAAGNFGTVRTSGAVALRPLEGAEPSPDAGGASVGPVSGEPAQPPSPGPVGSVGTGTLPAPGAPTAVQGVPISCKKQIVTGPQTERRLGGITILADAVGLTADGKEILCGNVSLNGSVKLDGIITLNPVTGEAEGEGTVLVGGKGGSRPIILFEGRFRLDPDLMELVKTSGIDRFDLSGFMVKIKKLKLVPGGLEIGGSISLELPKPLFSASFDVDTISVVNGEVNVAGKAKLPDFPLGKDRFRLKGAYLEFDWAKGKWVGHGELSAPDFISLEATLGFLNRDLNQLGLGVGGLKVPLGNTGLVLTGGYGEVSGLQTPNELKIIANLDMESVLKVGPINAVKINDLGVVIDLSGKVTGSGKMVVMEFVKLNGELVINWKDPAADLKGALTVATWMEGNGHLHVGRDGYYGKGRAVVFIPGYVPLFGNTQLADQQVHFTHREVTWKMDLAKLLKGSCRFVWPGDFDCSGNVKVPWKTSYTVPLLAALDDAVLLAALPDTSFTIAPGTEQAVVVLNWDQGDADFSLVAPDGRTITPADAPMTSPAIRYVKTAERREAFYAILNPTPGTWRHVVTPKGATTYTVELLDLTPPPAVFALTAPATDTTAGTSVHVTWTSDAPAGSTVSLFYARAAGELGTRFATGIPAATGSYTWNVEDVPSGEYTIYALLDDGMNAPVEAAASGKVRIANPKAPSTPRGLAAKAVGNGLIELTWAPGADPDVAGYRVRLLDAPGDEAVLGLDTSFTWSGLEGGKAYRFAVQAYDQEGFDSEWSQPASVTLPRPQPPSLTVAWPDRAEVNQREILLKGSIGAGATGTIYVDGVPAATGLTGAFERRVSLQIGQNEVKVVAVTAMGDLTESLREIYVDTIPPHFTVNGLTTEMHVQASAILVSGTVDPSAALTLNGRKVLVHPEGGYAAALPLKNGNNPVTLVARDAAGNEMTFKGIILVTAAASDRCGTRFGDVPGSHSACTAVEQLAALKVLSGYPDGTFKPDRGVTRAEFAKMLVAALGRAPRTGAAVAFSDTAGHWAAAQGYLQAAVALGAIAGFPDGSFQPDQPVTRAQVAKIAAAAAGLEPAGTPPYIDVAAGDWFAGWTAAATDLGLMGSRAPWPVWTGSRFDGNAPATRAEAAMVLANLLSGGR